MVTKPVIDRRKRKELNLGAMVKTRYGYFVVVSKNYDKELNATGYTLAPVDVSKEKFIEIEEFNSAVEKGLINL